MLLQMCFMYIHAASDVFHVYSLAPCRFLRLYHVYIQMCFCKNNYNKTEIISPILDLLKKLGHFKGHFI